MMWLTTAQEFDKSTDMPVETGTEKKTMGTKSPQLQISEQSLPSSLESVGFEITVKPLKRHSMR